MPVWNRHVLCLGIAGRENAAERWNGDMRNSASYHVLHHASPPHTQGDTLLDMTSLPVISSMTEAERKLKNKKGKRGAGGCSETVREDTYPVSFRL